MENPDLVRAEDNYSGLVLDLPLANEERNITSNELFEEVEELYKQFNIQNVSFGDVKSGALMSRFMEFLRHYNKDDLENLTRTIITKFGEPQRYAHYT